MKLDRLQTQPFIICKATLNIIGNMKAKIAKLVTMAIICVNASFSADCQTNSNGLAIIATTASLRTDTNAPMVSLMFALLNTTNHDIVVLTKGLDGSSWQSDTNKWSFTLGYDDDQETTCQDHKVVPSLYDLAPVNIKPNEVALVSQNFDLFESQHFTTNYQVTVRYFISTNWAARFGTWSGSVASQSFKVSAP